MRWISYKANDLTISFTLASARCLGFVDRPAKKPTPDLTERSTAAFLSTSHGFCDLTTGSVRSFDTENKC